MRLGYSTADGTHFHRELFPNFLENDEKKSDWRMASAPLVRLGADAEPPSCLRVCARPVTYRTVKRGRYRSEGELAPSHFKAGATAPLHQSVWAVHKLRDGCRRHAK